MNGIDNENLRKLRDSARQQLEALQERYDRKQRMKPIMEAMQKQVRSVMTEVTPNLLAGPEAQIRKSTLSFESSLAKFDTKQAEAEAGLESMIASLRLRTAALEKWLEALS
jgi:hypothetical protein